MQYLLGLLVDEGIADPAKLGSAGCSYGSAITLQLAMLRDRTRMLDGTLVPWLSPEGTPLEIKRRLRVLRRRRLGGDCSARTGASWTSSFPTRASRARRPASRRQASASGALALLGTQGYVAPPLVDPSADFQTWVATALAAPPDSAPLLERDRRAGELPQRDRHRHLGAQPAPMLIENGWADDYTPPEIGGLRMYRYLRGLRFQSQRLPAVRRLGSRAQQEQKRDDAIAMHDQATRFLDFHVRGGGKPRRRAR